jgi:hypothetical protein
MLSSQTPIPTVAERHNAVLDGTNGMALAHVKHLVLIRPCDHAVSNAGVVFNMTGVVTPADESTNGRRFRHLRVHIN